MVESLFISELLVMWNDIIAFFSMYFYTLTISLIKDYLGFGATKLADFFRNLLLAQICKCPKNLLGKNKWANKNQIDN